MVRGFDRLEDQMRQSQQGRQECQDKVQARLNALEQWKAGIVAITSLVSAVVSAVVAYIAGGGHK
jgi:hypothetical protein